MNMPAKCSILSERSGENNLPDCSMQNHVLAARSKLIDAIAAAGKLLTGTDEGAKEGQFPIGSKAKLSAAIKVAQNILTSNDVSEEYLKQAVWDMYDACVTYEINMVSQSASFNLVDSNATLQTKNLYANLVRYSYDHLMFGMHDATGYGVGWGNDDERSDVKDVCGDFPAVYSWDANRITQSIELDRFRYRITSAYDRGGINTFSWHQIDPLGRGFYASDVNNERIVSTLLPGGEYHHDYKIKLHQIANTVKALRGTDGFCIPVIFRPYHEHDGSWFWWGVGHCTSEEYNQLWQFTVLYLRDELNVHNFLYAISPSNFNSRFDYLDPYPGHEYIDIIGMDYYFGYPVSSAEKAEFLDRLRITAGLAEETNKVAALTEVGQEALRTSNWFTDVLLEPLKYDSIASAISYAAVWRNANANHFFAPYPGHTSVPDFIDFYKDPYTLFESDLADMYDTPVGDTSPPYFVSLPERNFIAGSTYVTITCETNERAFLRYSTVDEPYEHMPFEFQAGQGGRRHSFEVVGQQLEYFTYYVRAVDNYNNIMDTSAVITFTIDTLQAPVFWTDGRYVDTGWKTGYAPFGYGNTTDSTEVAQVPTVYFRKIGVLTEAVSAMGLLVYCHDGAVVYVNGIEVGRINMPEGVITDTTYALSEKNNAEVLVVNGDILHIGDNLVAVEVHQAQCSDPTISFDARLFDMTQFCFDLCSDWYYYDVGGRPPDQTVGGIQSGLEAYDPTIPGNFELFQNFPNPFNPQTTITYTLPVKCAVSLKVYNLIGREIASLVDAVHQAGSHAIQWNAITVPSGVYICRLTAGDVARTIKLAVVK